MASKWRIRNVRRLSDAKGANLVEAAIITPLLLLLTLAIVDFSSMFYGYLALEHGVSQATRLAVTGQTMTDGSGTALNRVDSIKYRMRQTTPTLTIPDAAFSFSFMAPGASSWSSGTRRSGRRRESDRRLHVDVHDAAHPALLHRRPAQSQGAIHHEERGGVQLMTHSSPCSRLRSSRGQSIVEFAICLPLLLVLTLGVVETSNALMSQHIITKVAREGSNMTSREIRLTDAGTALVNMSSAPGTFNTTTKVIFSVLMRSQTGSNNGSLVLYQRHQVGNLSLPGSMAERQRYVPGRERLHRGEPEQRHRPARHERADRHRFGSRRDDLRDRGLHDLHPDDPGHELRPSRFHAGCCIRSRYF